MNVCKICIAKYGFKLSDKDKSFETVDELAEHMEDVHGIPVMREGESEQQAVDRCAAKGIVPDTSKCQCKDCKEGRS